MRKSPFFLITGLALLSVLPSAAAQADQYAVVRNITGNAHVQGDDQGGQPQALTLNMPIMEDDRIWTGNSGQMGVMLQDGNYVWVGYNTRMEVDQLPGEDPRAGVPLRLKLWKGAVLLDLRNWSPGMASYVLSTPSASVNPARGGLYLVEVESVDRSRITCMGGSCTVSSAGSSVELGGRQMTYADYGYPPLTPMTESISYSSLLNYRKANTARSSDGVSERHLPSSLSAFSADFDNYGRWVSTDNYGYIWCPSGVSPDWNPYMDGRWWWGPWGMTWIPAEAWGWVPFHYGRWTFVAGLGWGWVPMPGFAPAWVSFYWGDGGWLGWCPLGYYGLPYWRHCGWYSVPVGYVYRRHLGGYIVHHRTSPPPRPIYPRARGNPSHLRKNGPPGRGGTGMHVSPVNLPPNRVRGYRNGRLGLRDLRAHLRDPVSVRSGRNFPSVRPSRGRGRWTQPSRRDGRERPAGGRGGAAAIPRSRPGAGSGRVEPRRLPPVREGFGGDPGGRAHPGDSYSPPARSRSRYGRRPPQRERPPVTREPGPKVTRAPGSRPGYRRTPPLVERRRATPPARPRVSERPRYIPSRPSTGMRPSRPSRGGGTRRSGGGGRHRR